MGFSSRVVGGVNVADGEEWCVGGSWLSCIGISLFFMKLLRSRGAFLLWNRPNPKHVSRSTYQVSLNSHQKASI